MGALLYLTLCSTKNRLRARVRRLREPRYAVGLAAGVAYFYFIFSPGGHAGNGPLAAAARSRGLLELVASVLLFVIVALAWLWPSDGTASLSFSRGEVQFLFPAPFTRRQLITYKLLRLQLGALASSAIMTLFFRPGTLSAGWTFLLGMWIVVSILIVHLTAVSLSRASIRQHGRAGLARQRLPLLLVLGAVVALATAVASAWPRLSTLGSRSEIVSSLQQIAATGLPAVVLWPFRAAARLPLSTTSAEFFRALPAALLLFVLNFAWAVRSDAAFEEASAELAEKVARIRSGAQPIVGRLRKRRPPFNLSATGPAEVALLWKNLIMFGRYASLKRALVFLPTAIIGGVVIALTSRRNAPAVAFAFVSLLLASITVLMGPMMVRNDLRRDLERLAMLKGWPIRGAVLLRGEALAPAAVLSVLAWIFILAASTSASHVMAGIGVRSAAEYLSYTAAALLLAPGLILVQVFIHNAMAVLFPAWVSVGPSHAHGIDVLGQRMLMVFGVLLALVIAVLPAAVIAGLAGAVIYAAVSVVPVVVPAAVLTTMLVAECALASEALGRVLDRTDPTAVEAID